VEKGELVIEGRKGEKGCEKVLGIIDIVAWALSFGN